MWFKVWSSVAHSFVDPEKHFRNLFYSEQLEKLNSLSGLQYHGEKGIKFSQWNRFSWFRFSKKSHNVPGEWLRIIVAHAACVHVNSVSATKASSTTLCLTSASPKPSPNGPSCSKDPSSTSSMSSSSPNSANISSSTCTSKNAHLIITFVTLVVKDFPSLDFASLSPSVPLIPSLPSHGSEMTLPSSSEITPASSSGFFSSRKSSYSKAASASVWLPWQVAERGKQLTFEQKFRQELEHEHPKTTWSL